MMEREWQSERVILERSIEEINGLIKEVAKNAYYDKKKKVTL